MLAVESGLAPAVIAARGYWTATTKRELADLGFAPAQRRVPALVLPIHGVYGEVVFHQIRPDVPRHGADGRAIKYDTPRKSQMVLDVPPPVRALLGDPSVPLFVTEGVKKGDALAAYDVCAVALLGVWNWRGSNAHGGSTVLADWETVALKARRVYIVFDSDVMTKPGVYQALVRLKAVLEARHADVALLYLPPGAHGSKQGVDDFLATGRSLAELLALATPTVRHPPVEAHPALPYQATPQGLVWLKPTAEGPRPVPLTNFTATITAEVVEDDGAETHRLFELEVQRQGQPVRFRVPAGQFASLSWVPEHLGATAVVLPGLQVKDQARAAIQLLSTAVAERRLYTHLGWREINGQWVYLHAGGGLGAQGAVPGIEVTPGEALGHYRLPPPPTGEALREAIRASLRFLEVAPEAVTLSLYSALWRAPLGSGAPSVHLVGATGAGKTELAALVQQHFGAAMHAKALPASWASTGNALESVAFQAKDAVLVIDDFCPTGAPADIQRYHKEGERVFRAQGNHSGRQRLRPDGTLRSAKPPRGLILSTGEDIPQGHSLRARLLILEVSAQTLLAHQAQFTVCQQDAAGGLYAQAMAGYVHWLAQHYGTIQTAWPAELIALRAQAPRGRHPRTPETMAQCGLGLQHFLAYAAAVGALSDAHCQALWQRAWTAFATVAEAQQEHQSSEAPERRFLALLAAALTAGHAHVVDATTLNAPRSPHDWGWVARPGGPGPVARETWHPQGDAIGWLTADHLYLDPEATFRVVQVFAAAQHAPLPVTQRTLWKRLRDAGLLTTQGEALRPTIVARLGPANRPHRVVALAPTLLSLETGNSGNNGNSLSNPLIHNVVSCYHFPQWWQAPVVTAVGTAPDTPASAVAAAAADGAACPPAAPGVTTAVTSPGAPVVTESLSQGLAPQGSPTSVVAVTTVTTSGRETSEPPQEKRTARSGEALLFPQAPLHAPAATPREADRRVGGQGQRPPPPDGGAALAVGHVVRLEHQGQALHPGVFVVEQIETVRHETLVTARALASGATVRYPSTCCVPVAGSDATAPEAPAP